LVEQFCFGQNRTKEADTTHEDLKTISAHLEENTRRSYDIKTKCIWNNTVKKNGLFVLFSKYSFLMTCVLRSSQSEGYELVCTFLSSVVSFSRNMTPYSLLWSLEFLRKFLNPKLFSEISTCFLISRRDLSLFKKTWLSVYLFLSQYLCLSTRFVKYL